VKPLVKQSFMEVKSSFGDYNISEIGDLEALFSYLKSIDDHYLLVDEQIAKNLEQELSKFEKKRIFSQAATESFKTLSTVEEICNWLNIGGATKDSTLIAIGGGIIQDLATFTSSVYFRGIDWVFVPTTLLSMADSCIGAKCALNLGGHKNQIGVFFAPSEVVLVKPFLSSLPDEHWISGLGEILKLSLTGENSFFDEFVRDATDRSKAYDLAKLSLLAKQKVIEEDELENDRRRILNYGHSFGHALEALSDNKISHGEAVVFGIDIINHLGVIWGITKTHARDQIRKESLKIFPSLQWPAPKDFARNLVEELKHDKKIKSGQIVFAVLQDTGRLTLVPKNLDEDLIKEVEEYLEVFWPKSTS
jgi:3-dehydroquinate synthase